MCYISLLNCACLETNPLEQEYIWDDPIPVKTGGSYGISYHIYSLMTLGVTHKVRHAQGVGWGVRVSVTYSVTWRWGMPYLAIVTLVFKKSFLLV